MVIRANEFDSILKDAPVFPLYFGSYHVPVVIENNKKDNYLDIQYGSGKGLYHLQDFIDHNAQVYTIWHRFNDEGNGIDMIERLSCDKGKCIENENR